MTGLPTLLVQLEDATGAFTHDITAYVKLAPGWDFRRGRNDEDDEIEPGRLSLTLNNNDSRFTLGAPTYDGIATDKRIRVSETIGGTTYVRFTGYVQDWPVEWTSPMATTAECKVVAIDRQARFNRRNLRSVVENEILLDKPLAYYTLGEPADSVSLGDTSGSGASSLTQAGSGTAVALGTAIGPGTDGLTAATYAGGRHLTGGNVTPGTAWTLGVAFSRTGLPATNETLLAFTTPTEALSVYLTPAGEIWTRHQIENNPVANSTAATPSASVVDGGTHIVYMSYDNTGPQIRVYVDDLTTSPVGTARPHSEPIVLSVGGGARTNGSFSSATFTGVISHVGVYPSALSAARIAAHKGSMLTGFATERADQRIARLAAYAGVTTADMDLEVGSQSTIASALTSGQKASAAMADVMAAEGGTLFIAGDGRLTMHSKNHRTLAATATASLVLTTSDVDPEGITWAADKDYLVNTVTATREGGAAQTSTNKTSVTKYDEYPADRTGLLLPTDDLALNLATWLTGMYGDVLPRLASFSLDLLTLPQATVQAALATKLGDRVTISGMPTQSPVATADLIVEGIKEEQSKGAWRLTFNTAPASLFRAWILGDATYGVLGTTTRLYF